MPRLSFAVVVVLLAGSSCDEAREELATRRQALEARDAIAAYAARVPETWPAQERWIAAVRSLAGHTDPKVIALTVAKDVSPALRTYARLLEAVPGVPAVLAVQHGAMVAAHDTLADAFIAFGEGLDRRSYASRRVALGLAADSFNRVQHAYVEDAAKHYAAFGVTVAVPPAVPVKL